MGVARHLVRAGEPGGPEGSSFSDSVEGALNEIGGCGNEGQLQRTMPNGCLPCSPGMWGLVTKENFFCLLQPALAPNLQR